MASSDILISQELDLFDDRKLQLSHEYTKTITLKTISQLSNVANRIVEFYIPKSDLYLDLKKTQLKLAIKLVKISATGKEDLAEDDGEVYPANLFLNALIERVDVYLGDTGEIVSPSHNLYGLAAYLETLLYYGLDAKKSHLTMEMYKRNGVTWRKDLMKNSKIAYLKGPFRHSLFKQNKLLLNQIDLRIKIHLKSPDFCLQYVLAAGKTHRVDYEIIDATLDICQVRPTASVAIAHEKVLNQGGVNAVYPIYHQIATHHTLVKGTTIFSYQNLFGASIPDQLFIVLQKAKTFEGDHTTDCFHFVHLKTKYLNITIDGVSYPSEALHLDFENDNYIDAYNTLFTSTNTFSQDLGTDISIEDYKKDTTIFGFDLSKTQTATANEIKDPQRSGSLGIDIHFADALDSNYVLIGLGYFKHTIEIDRDRSVIKTFR